MINKDDFKNIGYDDLVLTDLGGSSTVYSITLNGVNYLFKPSETKATKIKDPLKGLIQEAAYHVQLLVDKESAVPCVYVDNGKLSGTFQIRYDLDSNRPDYKEVIYKIYGHWKRPSPYNLNEIEQFMREFITDYLLYNPDSKGDNFITDSNGIIRGIDKELSLKPLYSDSNKHKSTSMYYLVNMWDEGATVYGSIFYLYVYRSIGLVFKQFLDKYIDKIEKVDDNVYMNIFKGYLDEIEPNEERELMYDYILKRKQYLRKGIYAFINILKEKRMEVIKGEEIKNLCW